MSIAQADGRFYLIYRAILGSVELCSGVFLRTTISSIVPSKETSDEENYLSLVNDPYTARLCRVSVANLSC